MDNLNSQNFQNPNIKLNPPKHLLNWDQTRSDLKKFLYLHIIRIMGEYRDPYSKLTTEKLVDNLVSNTGVLKDQLSLYIENLLFYGYLSESYFDSVITMTDKLYNDLHELDKVIVRSH